jgi:FKBP-type peptidyl-prolyl cis-trans isomerase
MALKVNCKECGEFISLRKMPHGRFVAFDYNTDTQHVHEKKVKTKSKKNSDTSVDNTQVENFSSKKTDDILASISSVSANEESLEENSLTQKSEKTPNELPYEVIEEGSKIKPSYIIIAILIGVIALLLVK